MHPTIWPARSRSLPPARRRQLADAMHDEELADLLQEMPEQEQIGFLAGLGPERIADVIEQMEPDDAVDLLGEMPATEREQLLAGCIAPGHAVDLRRLLSYDATTAGGLMTSQPLIVTPDTSRGRGPRADPAAHQGVTEAAQVYVCEPPAITPTGRYLGTVGFQRLLREPPAAPVAQCIEESSLCPARAAPNARSRPGWPRTTSSASRLRRMPAASSARSPLTTCSTGCCRRLAEGAE